MPDCTWLEDPNDLLSAPLQEKFRALVTHCKQLNTDLDSFNMFPGLSKTVTWEYKAHYYKGNLTVASTPHLSAPLYAPIMNFYMWGAIRRQAM